MVFTSDILEGDVFYDVHDEIDDNCGDSDNFDCGNKDNAEIIILSGYVDLKQILTQLFLYSSHHLKIILLDNNSWKTIY